MSSLAVRPDLSRVARKSYRVSLACLSRVVRDRAVSKPDYHSKRIFAIDRQRVRAVEFDPLIVRAQMLRRPVQILGLKDHRKDSLACAFEVLTLRTRR